MNEKILEFILYGGGAIAIAYATFTFLGKKTVESWFAKKLKKLDYDLNSLFSRVTKIHEKEFEVLPEAWSKMLDALGRVSSLVSMGKILPDLDRINKAELEEFIGRSRLHEHQKEELRNAPKKLEYYTKTIFWHDFQETNKAFGDFHNYIARNLVFLSSDLHDKFLELDNIMWSAIVERQVGQDDVDDYDYYDNGKVYRDMRINAYKKIRDDVNPVKDEIAVLIQKRLHYYDVD